MPRRCPICRKEIDEKGTARPFCSDRCKDVDLGRWLGEEYRISRAMTPNEVLAAIPQSTEDEEEGSPN